MKAKVNKIVESINKAKIIFNNIIDIKVDIFEKEYVTIITTIDKSIILNGINDKFNCELAKALLDTLKTLAKENDAPVDVKASFKEYFEIDEDFANMILKQISINSIICNGAWMMINKFISNIISIGFYNIFLYAVVLILIHQGIAQLLA